MNGRCLEKVLYFASTKAEGFNEPTGRGQINYEVRTLVKNACTEGFIHKISCNVTSMLRKRYRLIWRHSGLVTIL